MGKTKSTTIILTDADKTLVGKIQEHIGSTTIIAALRHALRFTVAKGKL